MTAATSGGLGDIIYSIPIMKALGVTDLYIKESLYFPPYGSMFTAMKDLVSMQGFNVHPTSGDYPMRKFDPTLKPDYNLDLFRRQQFRARNHIMTSMANQFDVKDKKLYLRPWLKVDGENSRKDYNLIHLTTRWRDGSTVNWKDVLNKMQGTVYFVGFLDEWIAFLKQTDGARRKAEYLETLNILDLAILVRDCDALYCNQSVALTIAQGLGKDYFCEFRPGKSNTKIRTKNEHVL